jgi:hypothetical protein
MEDQRASSIGDRMLSGSVAGGYPETRLTSQSGETMRVGAVQLTAGEDREDNLATADRLVREAAALGAELVALPEKWTVLGPDELLEAGAEPLDGPAI